MREYIIEANQAGYRIWIVDGEKRYPFDEQVYLSLVEARDQIPKRYRAKARLVHRTAYTEMINTPTGVSPPLDVR